MIGVMHALRLITHVTTKPVSILFESRAQALRKVYFVLDLSRAWLQDSYLCGHETSHEKTITSITMQLRNPPLNILKLSKPCVRYYTDKNNHFLLDRLSRS